MFKTKWERELNGAMLRICLNLNYCRRELSFFFYWNYVVRNFSFNTLQIKFFVNFLDYFIFVSRLILQFKLFKTYWQIYLLTLHANFKINQSLLNMIFFQFYQKFMTVIKHAFYKQTFVSKYNDNSATTWFIDLVINLKFKKLSTLKVFLL